MDVEQGGAKSSIAQRSEPASAMIIAIPGPIANNDADGRISQTGHYCGRADASFRHLRRHYLQQHAERWGAVRSLAKHKFCGHGPNQSIGQRFLEIHGAAENEGSGTPAAGVERIACAGYLSWPQEARSVTALSGSSAITCLVPCGRSTTSPWSSRSGSDPSISTQQLPSATKWKRIPFWNCRPMPQGRVTSARQ